MQFTQNVHSVIYTSFLVKWHTIIMCSPAPYTEHKWSSFSVFWTLHSVKEVDSGQRNPQWKRSCQQPWSGPRPVAQFGGTGMTVTGIAQKGRGAKNALCCLILEAWMSELVVLFFSISYWSQHKLKAWSPLRAWQMNLRLSWQLQSCSINQFLPTRHVVKAVQNTQLPTTTVFGVLLKTLSSQLKQRKLGCVELASWYTPIIYLQRWVCWLSQREMV